MKRQLRFIAVLITLSFTTKAQLPASTSPQNKKVLVEEYTGVNCGNCPNGHKIVSQMQASDPGNIIAVNIHESAAFSQPSQNEADFRTADGAVLGSTFNVSAYPSALINRALYNASYVVYANSFPPAAAAQTAQAAFCNVACQGTMDVQTRALNVQAQVYYTSNSPVTNNYLTVMLVEDDIMHWQQDWGPGFGFNPTNWHTTYANHRFYNHHAVLRKILTAPLGNTITTTTSGSTYNSGILSFTVPNMFGAGTNTNICYPGNLKLVAFVSQNNYNVANVAIGPIALTAHTYTRDISPTLASDNTACTGNYNAFLQFNNYGSAPITTAIFQYTANNGSPSTYTYNGNPVPASALSYPVAIPNLSFTPLSSNTIGINVISVNGSSDQNNANDSYSKTVPDAILTAVNSFTMNFYQDQFGASSYWTIIDEATGTPIQTDGPWTNLSSAGTQLNSKTFTLPGGNNCYKLKVFDSQGDGINGYYGSYGLGHYDLKSGATTLTNFNGWFTFENYSWFKTSFPLVAEHQALNINAVSVYPNPSSDKASLKININQHENVEVQITNAIGQMMYNKNYDLSSGINTLDLDCKNWGSGFYNVRCATPNGAVNLKLVITK